MGKKTKLISDPSLAHPHEAGSRIEVIQVLAHDPLGALAYPWPRLWVFHYDQAVDAYEAFEGLHSQLVELPPALDGMRTVSDGEFLKKIYALGAAMASNAVRAAQHICEEIERTTESPLSGSTLEERLAEASDFAGLPSPATRAGYQGIVEINRVRDAIEHPQASNVYNGHGNEWDRVPLAWMLSDRSLKAWERWHDFFTGLADEWLTVIGRFSKPATLSVERGIRSGLPVKKPPKR